MIRLQLNPMTLFTWSETPGLGELILLYLVVVVVLIYSILPAESSDEKFC